MTWRRWLALIVVVSVVAAAGIRLVLPELIRLGAIARIQAITGRSVTIDGVDVALLRGRLAVRGFRLADRGGENAPFAEFERLDLHVNFPALVRGHLWLHEVILRNSTVRVIRFPSSEFNLSDLVRSSGQTGRVLDVTVDRFAVQNGTLTLEDRALPDRRTWTSEHITIEAQNLSTRRQDGTAVGTSLTGGVPVSVRLAQLRLYPIHLEATVTVEGFDLAVARLYLPPDAPVILDQGRATTEVRVALDAREGLRIDGTVRLEELALVRPSGREPLALVPQLIARVSGLAFHPSGVQLGHLEVEGAAAVLDPSTRSAGQFVPASIHVSVDDLTWPVTTPARLEVATRVRGRGSLTVSGTLRPPTAPSDLRVRVVDFDLAPWARFVPVAARVTGIATADLHINEPLGAGIPARVRGAIAVSTVGVADARGPLLAAHRMEATGLQVDWPTRLAIGQLWLSQPRAVIERDRAGEFPVLGLWSRPGPPAGAPAVLPAGALPPSTSPPVALDIRRLVVQGGAIDWRDEAVAPPARLAFSRVEATATGAGWPLPGPLEVRLAARPPGGGQLQFAGRVGLDPFTAEGGIVARAADLAPYQPYIRTAARLSGWADLDLAVAVPAGPEAAPTLRGRAVLSRVDVRDGERTVLRMERTAATGLDVEWPRRVTARELALDAPWILLERDEKGAMPLRALLVAPGAAASANGVATAERSAPDATPVAVTVGRVTVAGGGARVVDRSIAPAFAVDLRRLSVKVDGLSTAPGRPAQIELSGQVGLDADVVLRGTLGVFGGPLHVDVTGELRRFAVQRVNSYLVRYAAWQAQEGTLTTSFQCRIQGDALDARTDIRLSRLQVTRAAATDETQARMGLPLNLIVALMRDARGDVRVTLPIGGRLNDPRFDFSEAIWSAVRTVAVKAITLPVSWIGRLHVTPDSRVERIQVDPIRFQPGAAMLTPDGQTQVTRVAAFLTEVPEVRMSLTPVVSARDLTTLRRQALEAAIGRHAEQTRGSRNAAAARLFKERLPDRRPPEELDALVTALVDTEATPGHAPALAAQRLEAARATLRAAGVDPARAIEARLVERPDAPEGTIELDLVEPDTPRRSQLLQFLRRLGSTKTAGEEERP